MSFLSHFGIFLIYLFFPFFVYAQVNITAPGTDATIQSCDDYFAQVWESPLDMTPASYTYSRNKYLHGDVLYNVGNVISGFPFEYGGLTVPAYSGGNLNVTTSNDLAFVRLLTPVLSGEYAGTFVTRRGGIRPVDVSKYQLLSFRANHSQDSNFQLAWDKATGVAGGLSGLIPVEKGWQTYQIDLTGLAVNPGASQWTANGNVHGLAYYLARFDSGTSINIDWIQLTPLSGSCPSYTLQYNSTAGQVHAIYLDDDMNPFNGHHFMGAPGEATGAAESEGVNSTTLYPGSYNVIGAQYDDYATFYGDPWDMDSARDINSSGSNGISPVGADGFSGGQFCYGTTTTAPWFTVERVNDDPIDLNAFYNFSLDITGIGTDSIRVTFFNSLGAELGRKAVATSGDGVYTLDLSTPDSGSYVGDVTFFRVQTGGTAGRNICVKWASLSNMARATEPSTAGVSLFPGSANLIVDKRHIAPFVIPDVRGGVDYFTNVKGDPANMDSSNDIYAVNNVSVGVINPGNSYPDSGGTIRTGDYLAMSSLTDGGILSEDAHAIMFFRETGFDSDRFKHACASLNVVDKAPATDHTVLRFAWEGGDSGVEAFSGDDTLLKTTGETEYCFNMEQYPIEDVATGATVTGDFWNNVTTFRVDPNELRDVVNSVISEVSLSADHEADQQFAIVLGGDREQAVSIFYNTANNTTGGTLIGTLSANRSTDVLLWNTAALPNGATYYLYSVVNGRRYLAEAPVVINHAEPLLTANAPVLTVEAPPTNGSGRYATLDVAGWAADDVRLAIVEFFIDGNFVMSFLPDTFHQTARDAQPTLRDISKAGFQHAIDLSGYADGAHTFRYDAYDTAGNKTTVSGSFTKASSSLTPAVTFPVPNELNENLPIGLPDPPGTGLAVSVRKVKKDIFYDISGAAGCSSVVLTGAKKSKQIRSNLGVIVVGEFTSADIAADGTITAVSTKGFKKKRGLKKKKPYYFKAICDNAVESDPASLKKRGLNKRKMHKVLKGSAVAQ